MYHFFVEEGSIVNNTITITGKDVNHIKNVLRMKSGEEISVSKPDSTAEYRGIIRELHDECVICDLAFIKEEGNELPSKIFLFQGLPKSDKMEMIIQKAVELGVFKVIPVEMKRCVMKLEPKKAASRIARWQSISEAAAKQSKRSIIPEISMPMSFKEAVAYADTLDIKLLPYELADGMPKTREIIGGIKPGKSIGIFIGPEGGFDTSEVDLAVSKGFESITLGKRILRTETAGMVVLSILGYLLEE